MDDFDPKRDYPLGTTRPDLVRTPSGRSLEDLTLAALRRGDIAAEDLRATPATLRRQASVAGSSGRAQLAANLGRAAELTAVPDDVILLVYTALRPAQIDRRRARGLGDHARERVRRSDHGSAGAGGASCLCRARPPRMTGSKRSDGRLASEVRKEVILSPAPELGLVALNGPGDPEPSLVVEDGRVLEMDGRRCEDFDILDTFIADHGLDLAVAEETHGLTDVEIARRLVDVDESREALVRLSRGLTPARLARIASLLDAVEMMFALKKLRARKRPANQAHVTNRKENPALLAADAAEAAARGFAEVETTVGVARYAPLNAMAILVGSQAGRPGVITQCAVEERRNLQLGHPRAHHVLRDPVGVRHGAVLRRRRRHSLVEGVPRVRLRVARHQGAVHVRGRLRGPDGSCRGLLDALPRGALPLRDSFGGLPGRPERRYQLCRAGVERPGGNA